MRDVGNRKVDLLEERERMGERGNKEVESGQQ